MHLFLAVRGKFGKYFTKIIIVNLIDTLDSFSAHKFVKFISYHFMQQALNIIIQKYRSMKNLLQTKVAGIYFYVLFCTSEYRYEKIKTNCSFSHHKYMQTHLGSFYVGS